MSSKLKWALGIAAVVVVVLVIQQVLSDRGTNVVASLAAPFAQRPATPVA